MLCLGSLSVCASAPVFPAITVTEYLLLYQYLSLCWSVSYLYQCLNLHLYLHLYLNLHVYLYVVLGLLMNCRHDNLSWNHINKN